MTPACPCPACAVASAVTLLQTGRPGMALTLLQGLPERMTCAARAVSHAAPKPRTGRRPKNHEHLAEALAQGWVTPAQVATVLGIKAEQVGAIAAGRTTLAVTSWRRLWRAVGRAEER